jgi:hypothetical protein
LIGAKFEQKAGAYIIWAAFHGFLADFQVSLLSGFEIVTSFLILTPVVLAVVPLNYFSWSFNPRIAP